MNDWPLKNPSFHCACRFSRAEDFGLSELIEPCGFHSKMAKELAEAEAKVLGQGHIEAQRDQFARELDGARVERSPAIEDALMEDRRRDAVKIHKLADALKHQRTALMIVRDRQGGRASEKDINQGIAQIDEALSFIPPDVELNEHQQEAEDMAPVNQADARRWRWCVQHPYETMMVLMEATNRDSYPGNGEQPTIEAVRRYFVDGIDTAPQRGPVTIHDAPPKRHLPTWADGMERAAGLLDEEAHSAEALAAEAGEKPTRTAMQRIAESMRLMARTVRAFKEAGPDSAPEEHRQPALPRDAVGCGDPVCVAAGRCRGHVAGSASNVPRPPNDRS